MTKQKDNPTIARLDRRAASIGLPLEKPSRFSRRFGMGDRVYTYRPGGKGVVKIECHINGDLEVEMTAQPQRVERLMRRARYSYGEGAAS